MKMHKWLLVLNLLNLGCSAVALGQNPADWKELTSFRPSADVQKVVQQIGQTATVHRIEDGKGDLNLDYYSIRVAKLPVVKGRMLSAPELLAHIRLQLNDFVDTELAKFSPFKESDKKKWNAEDPNGAVVLIEIPVFNTGVKATDLALVVTSMNSTDRWIFSTARGGSGYSAVNNRDNPGAHPVSGNREFGFQRAGDGWIFYTRGADRPTRRIDAAFAEKGFEQADKLWKSYQEKVAGFVNGNAGKAEVLKAVSKRYDWNVINKDKSAFDTAGQPSWLPVPPTK